MKTYLLPLSLLLQCCMQAEIDFAAICPLLELHEHLTGLGAGASHDTEALTQQFLQMEARWKSSQLPSLISFANDSMTIQLSEMFQHLADIDGGDLLVPASAPPLLPAHARASAAFQPSIGPSSHSNPAPTLNFQMRTTYEHAVSQASIQLRQQLAARLGYALWLGPSQAPTPLERAGVYLKGRALPGTVVGLYPGAAFNSEMLQKAVDQGHLGNARVPRTLIPRFDECVIDVHAAHAPKMNPYAIAHHVRHPPPSIHPNVVRIQFDFVADCNTPDAGIPFPAHLRDYIPNVWGADVSVGQELYGMLEQHIWAKGSVLVALRPLWDEELFADHLLPDSPSRPLPPWYTHINPARNARVWARLTG